MNPFRILGSGLILQCKTAPPGCRQRAGNFAIPSLDTRKGVSVSNPGSRPVSSSTCATPLWQSKLFWRMRDRWQLFWGEARTRILVWYILILTLAFGISVPLFRHLLFANIDARVRQEMVEEMNNFRRLLAGTSPFEDHKPGNHDLEDEEPDPHEINHQKTNSEIIDSQTIGHRSLRFQPPSTREQLKQFFNIYLAYQIPEDEVYFIALVGGQFYKSSPAGRPPDLSRDSVLMQRWAQQTQAEQGEQLSADPNVGSILYLVEPIQFRDQRLGVFVIAHSTAGERAEGLAATLIAAQVAGGVLLLALLLVWVAAGRVLQPLQTLATTVEAINESNLTQRIPVQGKGELARLAIQFNDMMDRVEIAFASQRDFVNDAGHELRTPLTIIRGHLELMDAQSAEQQETLAIVMDELDRMSRFVEDLILLAKAERPDFLQPETVDVANLTHELFAKAKTLAPRHWVLEGVAEGQITVDRQRITQAIMNLAHNATQHTQKTDTITFGSAIGKGKIHFWVRDTGTGIALADQKRIFERFARAANQRRRSEGAGLGLSIVKAIATAHGGEVTVRSQLGEGSTFAIVLPHEPPYKKEPD
jgi:signal transduction histidine kinase